VQWETDPCRRPDKPHEMPGCRVVALSSRVSVRVGFRVIFSVQLYSVVFAGNAVHITLMHVHARGRFIILSRSHIESLAIFIFPYTIHAATNGLCLLLKCTQFIALLDPADWGSSGPK